MPHFGLNSPPSFGSPTTPNMGSSSVPFGESSFTSPSEQPSSHSSSSSSSSSVKLSCLSPDGRAIHSYVVRHSMAIIETHALPLAGTVEGQYDNTDTDDDNSRNPDVPSVVRTTLPEHVASALQRYPALEMLCVDVDAEASSSSSSTTDGSGATYNMLKRLPRLCIYSKKDVFLLELGYHVVSNGGDSGGPREVEGTVVSVTEPFDEVLIGNATSTSIIRIRQAPQQFKGYITLCPAGAMAMLTHNNVVNEYALTLYHGKGGSGGGSSSAPLLSTPLVHSMEQLDEQMMEQITDFCFCQSNAFALLSSLSVAFLKASGEVLQASPVLFRGTVVPQDAVTQTLVFLEGQIGRHEPTTARGRQFRSARQYIVDCFPNENVRGHFLTGQERSSAFEWQAQMQGPVLLLPESDDLETVATAIEPVPAGDFCGLAIGHIGYKVEFGLLAPTLFIPRFQLESRQDTMKLDQDLNWGAIVNRVDLRDDDNEEQHQPSPAMINSSSLALVPDPIMETVVHYVTPNGITSISTNALQITANKMRDAAAETAGGGGGGHLFSPPSKRKDRTPRTTGWSCLEVSNIDDSDGDGGSSRKSVVGAVVSGDVQFGHVLVARLSNGSMFAINLTESRQLQEMEAIGESSNREQQLALTSHAAASSSKELQALHDTAPLVEIAQPLLEKAANGLRGMTKIVGSATPVDKITPDLLAAAAQVKEQIDTEVMLPIMELNEHVKARKREIAVMFNNQMAQLAALKEMLATLKKGEASIGEKTEVVSANAESLAKRSASVLQSANDLRPTITQAEFDYFQELERLQGRTKQWQEQLELLQRKASTLRDSAENGTNNGKMNIPESTLMHLREMLKGSDTIMKKYDARLTDAEYRVDQLAAAAGWDRDPHGPVGAMQ